MLLYFAHTVYASVTVVWSETWCYRYESWRIGAGDGAERRLGVSVLQLEVDTFNFKVLAFIKITRIAC